MMIFTHRHALSVSAALIALPIYGSSLNMNDGQWEMRFHSSIGGMKMPVITNQQCLTKKDLVPKPNPDDNDGCGPLDIKFNGNTVSWKVACKQSIGSGKVTYHGDTMKGEMIVTSNSAGMRMEMKSIITGKRLADCQ